MTSSRGFSLIELMVAVTLFAVVMLVSVGALLSLVDANRKARSLESVMNNLNIAIDGLVRSIRMGNTFHCGSHTLPAEDGSADCGDGEDEDTFSFAPFGANPADEDERWAYRFVTDVNGIGRIERSRDGGDTYIPITAPEVDIEAVDFYVVGTERGSYNPGNPNVTQPKVVIVIKGIAGAENERTSSTFYIQATAVQRVLDL